MYGLQVWAHSYCRSTLSFYDALARNLGTRLRICLGKSGLGIRRAVGFTEDEFANLDIIDVSVGVDAAEKALDEHAKWHQLFGVYQTMPHIQKAIKTAFRRGCRVAIASEAPCNMESPGIRRIAKDVYIHSLARTRFADITARAEFLINWSGDDARMARNLGWEDRKIIPCGYFSPPLLTAKFVPRSAIDLKPLHILCTGSMTWHRGPDIVLSALVLLKSWGFDFRATFTGTGPMEAQLREMASTNHLDCEFPGSVAMPDLIDLYQTCTLFIAAGRSEPWGMRVNDALNCGAPAIVSRGMGSRKLLFDYGCGATFAAGDAVDLAWQIRRLTEPDQYQKACENLVRNRNELLPEQAAHRVTKILKRDFSGWLNPIC